MICPQCVALKAENERFREREEQNGDWHAVVKMIGDALEEIGCDCGPNAHKATPPMFYPEWIVCVLQSKTRELREQNATANGDAQ